MALNFPNSPNIGDLYTADNNIRYQYDGEKWTTSPVIGGDNPAIIVSGTPPTGNSDGDQWFDSDSGNEFVWYVNAGDSDSEGAWIQSNPTQEVLDAINVISTSGGDITGNLNVSGNIGIGTTNPGSKLHVAGSGYQSLLLQRDGSVVAGGNIHFKSKFEGTDYWGGIIKVTDGDMDFMTSYRSTTEPTTPRLRIDTSGRLLVGTSSSRGIGSGTEGQFQIEIAAGQVAASIVNNYNTATGAILSLGHSRTTTIGSNTLLQADDQLGEIRFAGADGTDLFSYGAAITAEVDGTPGANDLPGRLVFSTTADGASSPTERMRIASDGRATFANDVRIDGGTTSVPALLLTANNNTGKGLEIRNAGNSLNVDIGVDGSAYFAGDFMVGKTSTSTSVAGTLLASNKYLTQTRDNGTVIFVNRLTSDGTLINFEQNNTTEGSISVSGSTVSYNGAHLSRWSQLASGAERIEIPRGSVLSNLDEMCEWSYDAEPEVLWSEDDELPEGVSVGDIKTPAKAAGLEDNEQLNRMKVSDVEGDRNVAGVFQSWDDDDDTYTNDFYCAMTGDFVIRIAQGTTVARGDLLMSAGDGTAKPQDDDIVRSKTIAKVTSTTVSETYSDGSYCVPCVLMAC